MKVYTNIISPLMFGTWVLRISNDINVDKGLNYIQIQEEPIIKLKTLKQDGLFGQKNSRTAYINNINFIDENSYSFKLKFSRKNIYSYSFLGIQIPEYKSNSLSYIKEQNYTIKLYDKTIIITNDENYLYYIFDLYIGKLKYPNAETSINTFMFTQIFSIILSLLFTKLL
jgi:hypothetical protein